MHMKNNMVWLSLLRLSLLLLGSICLLASAASDANDHGFSIKLIYRDSPESPLYQPNLTREERMERLVRMSDARLESLINRSSRNMSSQNLYDPQTIRPPISGFDAFVYMVEVGIGTFESVPPYMKTYLALDTGSPVIWTQCEGCSPCFPQQSPPFPKSRSRTYRPISCSNCPPGIPCGRDCMESHTYHDGSRVVGIPARETFTFQSDSRAFERLRKIAFLCAMYTERFRPGQEQNNIVSGILGMSRRRGSLPRQLGPDSKFSYCLQPLDVFSRRTGIPMVLRFNTDVPNIRNGYTTPLLLGDSNQYYLDLVGLSVGETRLNIGPEVFRSSEGCVIDSGATSSYIVNDAYYALENALVQQISERHHDLARVRPPKERFRLCYVRTNSEVMASRLPRVTFHFANDANFVLRSNVYMKIYADESARQCICLEIKPTPSLTVLGAMQQVNHRIVYDIGQSQLQFVREDCSSSN